MDNLTYMDLVKGNIPPYAMRFIKGVGRTINRYRMIQDGDVVVLGISGGKDSLSLALALSLRRKWLPITYSLRALMIDQSDYPIPDGDKEKLGEYFDRLDIDFEIVRQRRFPEDGKFNCYLCSRNRRITLFKYAESKGAKLIAMGHHLDDIVETSIMNLFFRQSFSTMLPVQEFFSGSMYIIRPLSETRESTVSRIASDFSLPVVKPVCPYDKINVRSALKPIVSSLSAIDKLSREHLYNAHDFSSCVMPDRQNIGKNNSPVIE